QLTDQQHPIGGYPDLLVHHPRQPQLMFVASAEKGPGSWFQDRYAGSRISRSADGGQTWEAVRHGFPDRPLRTAFEAMCLEDWGESFSLFGATATGEVWCSDDGGEHWSEVLSGLAPVSTGPHYRASSRAGLFAVPHTIRVDASDNLWLVDRDHGQMFQFTLDGKLLRTIGIRGYRSDTGVDPSEPRSSAYRKVTRGGGPFNLPT